MSQEHARIGHLKQQWDDEDTERDELERRAKQLFLEEHANQIFAPIEDYLTRLDKVLRAVDGSVEIDAMWEHLGDRRLRRVAKVASTESTQQLLVDLTIQEATIFYIADRSARGLAENTVNTLVCDKVAKSIADADADMET
jgi:hypothetical protein